MSTALPGSVVVGVDGSADNRPALRWAADYATRGRLPLHLVHALGLDYTLGATMLDSTEILPAMPVDEIRNQIESDSVVRVVDAARELVRSIAPGLQVTSEAQTGLAGSLLVSRSATASLLVTGARGRGAVRSALLGSVSLQVAMHAACPVVVVRDRPDPDRAPVPGARIVVGVDGSPGSGPALDFAFAQASARDAGLTAVHATWVEPVDDLFASADPAHAERVRREHQLVSDSLATWRDKYPDVNVREHLLWAHPVDALVDHSVGADLVVVGTRGHGGFAGLLLGSVSHGLLQHSFCPVAVVK